MDKIKAAQLANSLIGTKIDGWLVEKHIDHGKTAAVFQASKGADQAAIKVYDDELIARFGDETFQQRCAREAKLVGLCHPNLVQLYEHGRLPDSEHSYLVMEFLKGPSLEKALGSIPPENIGSLISQLAAAARFLEEHGFVHRDIKPANIVVDPDLSELKLLDFGVVRPVAASDLTDSGESDIFVGTNQYASPEFALRKEVQDLLGWRAISFYQIGAVLHDLLTGKPLFKESLSVPARLAKAVQEEVPDFSQSEGDPVLVLLAQRCLVKNPKMRVQEVGDWESFSLERLASGSVDLAERLNAAITGSATKSHELGRLSDDSSLEAKHLFELTQIIKVFFSEEFRSDPCLPNRICWEREGDGIVWQVDFEPDQTLGFKEGLSLSLRIEVSGTEHAWVRISGAYGPKPVAEEFQASQSEGVYSGSLDKAALDNALRGFVQRAALAMHENAIPEGL